MFESDLCLFGGGWHDKGGPVGLCAKFTGQKKKGTEV